MSERGFVLASVESSLNRFSSRMGGSEDILMVSNSAYGQDECSLSEVKNFCFGGNPLGAFGLVFLGGLFRENFF